MRWPEPPPECPAPTGLAVLGADAQVHPVTRLPMFVGMRDYPEGRLPVWLVESPVPRDQFVAIERDTTGTPSRVSLEICYCQHEGWTRHA